VLDKSALYICREPIMEIKKLMRVWPHPGRHT